MTRKKAREQAFLLFFEKSFHPETDIEDIAELAFDSGLVENDDYVGMIAKIASEKLFEIDELIENNLRGWRKTRISKVSACRDEACFVRNAVCGRGSRQRFDKRGC